MAELVGSMVVSGLVSLLVALVMILVRGAWTGGGGPIEPNQYAWLALSAIVGCWGVLIPAKLWQGGAEDATLRRFTMLSIGLAVGAAIYAIHSALLVSLPYEMWPFREWRFSHSWHGFYSDYGAPTIYAFLAYFGIVFFIPRWWRLADPLRRSRLAIWATAFDIGAAGIANLVLPFPQPWGFLLVATVSIAVQMSSTWIPWANRTRAAQ
jgi:hypothetical protein